MPRIVRDDIEDTKYWLRRLFSDFHVPAVRGVALPDFTEAFMVRLRGACERYEVSLPRRQLDVLKYTYARFVDDRGLTWCLSQAEIAELIGVDVRTVQRELRAALEALSHDPK